MSHRPHGWSLSSQRAWIPSHIRSFVMRRDGGRCRVQWDVGCLGKATELDHVVPHAGGGSDTAPNLRAACSYCNAKRNIATRPRPRSTRRTPEPPPGLLPPR